MKILVERKRKSQLHNLCSWLYGPEISIAVFSRLSEQCLACLCLEEFPETIEFNSDIPQFQRFHYVYSFLLDKLSKCQSLESIQELQKLWCFLTMMDLNREGPPYALVSLRLNGVRQLLHPHSSAISPVSIASIYAHLYWTLQSVSLSFLHLLNHSPLCQLAATLSRATLLVNYATLNKHKGGIRRLDSFVKSIHPTLSLELREEILTQSDLTSRLIERKTALCNAGAAPKRTEKGQFYFEKAHPPLSEKTIMEWTSSFLKQSNSRYMYLNFSQHTDLPFKFSHESYRNIPAVVFERKGLFPRSTESLFCSHGSLSLQELSKRYLSDHLGTMRIDVSGFLESMGNFSQGVLYKQQAYRCYHQQFYFEKIPSVIESINHSRSSPFPVIIVHSILDDAVLFGCKKDVELVFSRLQKKYAHRWGGTLKCGFGELRIGATAADISFQALGNLENE